MSAFNLRQTAPATSRLTATLSIIVIMVAAIVLVGRYCRLLSENRYWQGLLAQAAVRHTRAQADLKRLAAMQTAGEAADSGLLNELMDLRGQVGLLTRTLTEVHAAQRSTGGLGTTSAALSNSVVSLRERAGAARTYGSLLESNLTYLINKYDLPEKGELQQVVTPRAGDVVEMSEKLAEALSGAFLPFTVEARTNGVGLARIAWSPEQWGRQGITNFGRFIVLGPANFRLIRASPANAPGGN